MRSSQRRWMSLSASKLCARAILVVVVWSGWCVSAAASPSTKLAILVGVEDHQDSTITPLRYAVDDMVLLKQNLQAQGYQVVSFLQGTRGQQRFPTPGLHDVRTPSQAVLLNYLRDIQGSYSGATLLFAFSGHGFADAQGQNYLALTDTRADDIEGTALSLPDVQRALIASGARVQYLLLDACRNLPSPRQQKAIVFRHHESPLPLQSWADGNAAGMAMMFAASQGSYSWEASRRDWSRQGYALFDETSEGHGVFTYFVVKGLQGAAAEADGQITFDSLFDYVSQQTRAWQPSRPQLPRASKLETYGQLVIAEAPPHAINSATFLHAPVVPHVLDDGVLRGWLALVLLAVIGGIGWRLKQMNVWSRVLGHEKKASSSVCLTSLENQQVLARLTPGEVLLLGRDSQADLVLDDDVISAQHVRVMFDTAGRLWLEDLGSTNGSFVGHQRVEPHCRIALRLGSTFHLASSRFGYCIRSLSA